MTKKPYNSGLVGWYAIVLFMVTVLGDFTVAVARSLEGYTAQNAIDSMVLDAVYLMDEAATFEGLETRQRAAIGHARQVVAKLRKMAENNPNQQYILWKASELESQIFLEENGLLVEDAKKRQKEIQRIIDQFNGEISRKRPNFIEMQKLHAQMGALDAKKSNEFLFSLTDRQRNISREVVMMIEKALNSENFSAARSDLDYCEDMQAVLSVQPQKIRALRASLTSQTNVEEERAYVMSRGRLADSLCVVGAIGPAQDTLMRIRRRLESLRGVLSTSEWEKAHNRTLALLRRLSTYEDSLVEVGLTTLRIGGIFAAVDYKEKLERMGVHPGKIALINQAIVSAAVARQNTRDEKIGKELEQLVQESESDAFGVTDLTSSAKRKAQQRSDSLRIVQERQALAALSPRERKRREREHAASVRKQEEELRFAQTSEETIAIYSLIEQGRISEARMRFSKGKKAFKKYLHKEAFVMLQNTLEQSLAYARSAR